MEQRRGASVEGHVHPGADGVHLGGTDAGVAAVRALLGPDKIIGASCYGDLALAQAAQHKVHRVSDAAPSA